MVITLLPPFCFTFAASLLSEAPLTPLLFTTIAMPIRLRFSPIFASFHATRQRIVAAQHAAMV